MSKEMEVKILNVNVEKTIRLLEDNGCFCQFDRIQRLVTFDFHPINSTYFQLQYELMNNHGKSNFTIVCTKMRSLLIDLFEIMSDHDMNLINEKTNEFSISELFKENIDYTKCELLKSPLFIDIVSKYSINPNKWIRVRTDGVTTTITTKYIKRSTSQFINKYNIDAVDETEIVINDFDTGIELMRQLGYFFRNYQEKRRIMYKSDNGLEIDIDCWPMIPPYLEIEGKNEKDIYDLVNRLGFNKSDAIIANTDDVYKIYDLDIYSFPELKFNVSKSGDSNEIHFKRS